MRPGPSQPVRPDAPGDAVLFSEKALYETYNFQDPQITERLAEWLARGVDDDGPGVCVVAGAPGTGRDYAVRAAAWLAEKRVGPVQHVRLSFDGFDPDHPSSMTVFAAHQLRRHVAPDESQTAAPASEGNSALLQVAATIPATFLGAAWVSFVASAVLSVVNVGALLDSDLPALAGPRASPDERLRAVIDFATRDGRLVLVVPAEEIPESVVKWFAHEPRRSRRLSVVLCVANAPEEATLYGEALGPVVKLGPMTKQELRHRVDLRFGPNVFTNHFFAGVWNRTQGVAGQVALAMMEMERKELITRNRERGAPWCVATAADDTRLVEYFASHFYEDLNKLRDREGPLDLFVVRFIEVAALCGPILPARLITAHLGLNEQESDEILELVDRLEDMGRPVFRSHDYLHPTFSNEQGAPELVYSFTDESNRMIVLLRMQNKAREASAFLTYLSDRRPGITRGAAEVFASLAAHLRDAPEHADHVRHLRWWVGAAEAEGLSEQLSDQLRAGELNSGILWAHVQRSSEWPAVRRLALLDAMQSDPDGIALDLLPRYHLLRGQLHQRIGRVQDAIVSYEAALRVSDPAELRWLASLHHLISSCAEIAGDEDKAGVHARAYHAVISRLSGVAAIEKAHAAIQAARALIRYDLREEARPFIDEGLRALETEESEGGQRCELTWRTHSAVLNLFGKVFSWLDEDETAVAYYKRSLSFCVGADATTPDGIFNQAIVRYNLAVSLIPLGAIEEAQTNLARTKRDLLDVAGPLHYGYGSALLLLLWIEWDRASSDEQAELAQQLWVFISTAAPEAVDFVRVTAAWLMHLQEVGGAERRYFSPDAQKLMDTLWNGPAGDPPSLSGA